MPGIKLPVRLAVLYLNFLLQQPHIHGSGNNITDHSRLESISGVHLVLSIYSPAIGCPGPCPGFWIYPKVFHNCSGQHVQVLYHFCSLMFGWRFTCSSFCTLPFVLLLRAVEKSSFLSSLHYPFTYSYILMKKHCLLSQLFFIGNLLLFLERFLIFVVPHCQTHPSSIISFLK